LPRAEEFEMRMRPTMRRLIWVSLLLSAFAYGGSTSGQTSGRMPALSAQSWPEADLLFRNDPSWLGADDAYSIDLGNGRVLWLFADTFIALRPGGTRHQSKMIRNSVAIQQGLRSFLGIDKILLARNARQASFFFRRATRRLVLAGRWNRGRWPPANLLDEDSRNENRSGI
jgi:hypothetical protein